MSKLSTSTNIQNIQLKEVATPSTPSTGYGRAYLTTAPQLAFVDDAGNVHLVSSETDGTYTARVPFPIQTGGGTATVETFLGAPSINLDLDLETFLHALRVPYNWDAASDITVWLDVANEIAEDDGDDLSFDFQMRGYADGETMSDAGYAPSTATLNLTGGDQAINVINRITAAYDYDDGTYPLAANDTLVIEVTVNLGGAGEVTGPLHVIAWGLEYTAKLGA